MLRNTLQPLSLAQAVYSAGLAAVFFLVSLGAAQAATIKLAWDTVSGASGYQVYYGTASGNYNATGSPLNVVGSTTASVTIPDSVTYYFAVKAYDSASGRVSGFSNEVNNPIAKFSANKTTVATSESVQFTDSSTGAVTGWSWNFGDGTTSALQNPPKSYATAGTYPVSLVVTGLGGITNTSTTQTITVNESTTTAPVASFTASPVSGDAPLSVTLKDTSTGSNIASRTWNFGDGATTTVTTAQTFVRSYAYGTYTVSLALKDSTGKVLSTSNPQTITAKAVPPAAKFSASPTTGTAPLPVTFANQSTGTNLSYAWDFGVPNTTSDTSTAQNPTYTYASSGTYTVKLTATGVAGTTPSTTTQTITVSQANTNAGSLVAAYNFQEGSGTTVQDASGQGNHGTLSNVSWTTNGQFGNALSFNGSNSYVTVADKNSLDLTNGMTLEAWVYPTAISGGRSVLVKENPPGNSVYYLYANATDDNANKPLGGGVFAGTYKYVYGGSQLTTNQWTHLAATYDGVTERLFVNGVQVASRAQTGNMLVSTGALRIGGNSIWGEYFQGRIDEVRIYNRALSATEIQADMKSLPPTQLLGDSPLDSQIATTTKPDPISKGTAKAFLKKADKTGTVTSLSVYVASGSTALVAGLYANDSSSGKNRPGTLLAQGTLSLPKAGWNHVSLPAKTINAGTTYWIAILSPGGELQISDKVNGGTQPSETSPYTTSSTLPNPWWSTGVTPSSDGPVAGYGAGY